MATFEVSDELKLKIESVTLIHGDDELVDTLYRLWRALQAVVAANKVQLVQDAQDPTKYEYKLVAADGRVWKQSVVTAPQPDDMLIEVNAGNDWWTLKEVNAHRDLRALFFQLVTAYGMTSIIIKLPQP